MAFFRRLMDHMLNQVLVESLANSRWFQRFAVWSHKMGKDLHELGQGQAKVMDGKLSQFSDTAKQMTAQLRKEFEQEMKKLSEQQAQQHRQSKR